MDYDRPYPNMLRVIRQSTGMKQHHVARLLGLSETVSLCQWESEKTMPSGTNLIKLCIIYGRSIHELYPEYCQIIERNMHALGQ